MKTKLVVGALSFVLVLSIAAAFAMAASAEKPALAEGQKLTDANEFLGHIAQQKHVAVCAAEGIDGVRCHARVVVDDKGTPKATNSVVSGYGPAQFHGAYGLPADASGSPVIGIVDAYNDPSIASDLATYSAAFGIPTLPACSASITSSAVPCFQKVNQNGGTSYPKTNSSWSLEISLDVEIAHATCENCKILLVEARSASYSDLLAAVDRARTMGAKYISNSYGSNEFSGETTYDGHFNHPGIAFTFSAGDSGYGTGYPAASPYVVSVGGTTLAIASGTMYGGEIAWNGTGSGCSLFEAKPAWQTDAGCAMRTMNDVAADADPSTGAAVYDSVSYAGQRGWFQVGGTSLSSPLIAASYALAGDVPSNAYAAALPHANTSGLNDVSAGSNGSCGTYLCNAGVGYDGPTGLGTPNSLSSL